ncbi:MAG: hypothetical protein JNL87_00120 [Burkholderiaceae bacterium]|nr:hypothetical protein [Burkholderiaceae bacterium]
MDNLQSGLDIDAADALGLREPAARTPPVGSASAPARSLIRTASFH